MRLAGGMWSQDTGLKTVLHLATEHCGLGIGLCLEELGLRLGLGLGLGLEVSSSQLASQFT